MDLILVRHGVTAETGTRLTGRAPGVGLSPAGRDQAATTAAAIAAMAPKVRRVLTSPIARCRETAEIIAERLGAPMELEGRLVEVDYGAWTGRTLRSLRRLKKWRELFVSATRFQFPDGERFPAVLERAVAAVEDAAGRHRPDDVVVAVSHADVIRVLLVAYLGMPLDAVHRLDVRPAAWSRIVLRPGAPPMVPNVNMTPVVAAPSHDDAAGGGS